MSAGEHHHAHSHKIGQTPSWGQIRPAARGQIEPSNSFEIDPAALSRAPVHWRFIEADPPSTGGWCGLIGMVELARCSVASCDDGR